MEPRLILPGTLLGQNIALRAQTDADAEFIRELYASVRWQELSTTGWPEELKHAFLAQQLALQTRHYLSHYSSLRRDIILRESRPIGRIYLWKNDSDLHIVDLSLLPAHRHRGIGTQLLRAVIDEAWRTGSSTSLHVEQGNPARLLYQRLGFRSEDGGKAAYQFMRCPPPLQK